MSNVLVSYECLLVDIIYNTSFYMYLFLILVAPTKVVLADENGDTLPHNSALGPLREGAQLLLFCEAFDGRPAPKITWRQGERNLKG